MRPSQQGYEEDIFSRHLENAGETFLSYKTLLQKALHGSDGNPGAGRIDLQGKRDAMSRERL